MHFWVYHKQAKQKLGPFNERAIVDFCLTNKESIKNYYFSVGSSKELMEWESFAMKHAELFAEKAKEREKREEEESSIKEIPTEKKRSPLPFVIIILLIVAGAAAAYFLVGKKEAPKPAVKEKVVKKKAPAKKVVYPIRRAEKPSDLEFSGKPKSDDLLRKAWKNSKKKIPAQLSPAIIKDQMDGYLPSLQLCFDERVKAGDRNLKGQIELRIRVGGDGTVLDVLFTSDKYRSTLFGDCLAKEIQKKPFPMFRGKEQTFNYYWNL